MGGCTAGGRPIGPERAPARDASPRPAARSA
jgi:hypothetical protein